MQNNPKTDNSNFTDGFPTNDNNKKKEDITSKDPSRPFDSGRPVETREKKLDKDYNPTGSTMNEENNHSKK